MKENIAFQLPCQSLGFGRIFDSGGYFEKGFVDSPLFELVCEVARDFHDFV